MLKWTVHKRADSTLTLSQSTVPLNSRRSLGTLPRRDNRSDCRRKSLGSSEITRRINNRDKENTHICTPHPFVYRGNATSTPAQPFNKLDFALRDVRNLTPKNTGSITSLVSAVTPSRKRPLAKTPPSSPPSPMEALEMRLPAQSTPTTYASTLPTFDVEYSPCAATISVCSNKRSTISTIGITDSYFNQPRYFQAPLPASKRLKFSPSVDTASLNSRVPELSCGKNAMTDEDDVMATKDIEVQTKTFGKKSTKNCNNCNNNNNNIETSTKFVVPKAPSPVDESLSSSALNDTALDKMIDAILESARKERPSIRRGLAARKVHLVLGANAAPAYTDSPTYTAAEDPASDLNKYCDNFVISPEKLVAAGERTIILAESIKVNEREVRTPEATLDAKRSRIEMESNVTEPKSDCHLRRQRAVRRKNPTKTKEEKTKKVAEIKSIETTRINSSPKTPNDIDFANSSFFKKNIDELANMNTPTLSTELQVNNGIPSISSKLSYECTPLIHSNDLQASSTPTNGVASIRRCLNFSQSPNGDDDSIIEKRKSTASSTSTMTSTSTSSYCRLIGSHAISGSLDLSLFVENDKLNIHGELV